MHHMKPMHHRHHHTPVNMSCWVPNLSGKGGNPIWNYRCPDYKPAPSNGHGHHGMDVFGERGGANIGRR